MSILNVKWITIKISKRICFQNETKIILFFKMELYIFFNYIRRKLRWIINNKCIQYIYYNTKFIMMKIFYLLFRLFMNYTNITYCSKFVFLSLIFFYFLCWFSFKLIIFQVFGAKWIFNYVLFLILIDLICDDQDSQFLVRKK